MFYDEANKLFLVLHGKNLKPAHICQLKLRDAVYQTRFLEYCSGIMRQEEPGLAGLHAMFEVSTSC